VNFRTLLVREWDSEIREGKWRRCTVEQPSRHDTVTCYEGQHVQKEREILKWTLYHTGQGLTMVKTPPETDEFDQIFYIYHLSCFIIFFFFHFNFWNKEMQNTIISKMQTITVENARQKKYRGSVGDDFNASFISWSCVCMACLYYLSIQRKNQREKVKKPLNSYTSYNRY
jgi:hypothetical protein